MSEREDAWRTVELEAPPFRLEIPPHWDAVEMNDVTAVISPAVADDRYRANVTIGAARIEAVGELRELGDSHLRDLERTLTDFQLIDVTEAQLGAFPGIRLTASFRQGMYDLTLDEWIGLTADAVVTASAIATNSDYAGEVDNFERIVASVEPA